MGQRDGSWTLNDHISNIWNSDYGLTRVLEDRYKNTVSSVMDFGSGTGKFLTPFVMEGKRCVGFEPSIPWGPPGVCWFMVDICQYPDPIVGEKFDLVLCIEVMEHIPRPFHGRVFDFLVDHVGEVLIFSGAHPGQEGEGHVSCRDKMEWRRELLDRGLVFDGVTTFDVLKECQSPWLRDNVQVFCV